MPTYREEFFLYTTGWSDPVAAIGANIVQQISISEDAVFKAYYLTLHIRQGAPGAELIVLNFSGTISIEDSSLGKTLMNVPIPCDALVANGQNVYNFAPPRLFNGNSTIIITTVPPVADATAACIVLHGAKLLPFGAGM